MSDGLTDEEIKTLIGVLVDAQFISPDVVTAKDELLAELARLRQENEELKQYKKLSVANRKKGIIS